VFNKVISKCLGIYLAECNINKKDKSYKPLVFNAVLCVPKCIIVSNYVYKENKNYKLYYLHPYCNFVQ
jgi:hypothetical protein